MVERVICPGCIGLVGFALLSGCSPGAGSRAGTDGRSGDVGAGDDPYASGAELRVPVADSGRAFVKLDAPSVVPAMAAPQASTDWDLAFEGFDIFTNGGASGAGKGASLGPFDAATFAEDQAPAAPFLTADRAGGAFLNWYGYEGAPSHGLWSRFHVFGVQDGDRLWKVQVLGYYGERDGAVIPGLYTLRYAELTAVGPSPTQEVSNLDGTAGGAQAPASAPSECMDLGTAVRTKLTPEEARTSTAWHLCFRRQSIFVNGESGGPRGVGAVNLEADQAASESIDTLKLRTPESERGKFDAVTRQSFDGRVFRGDRIVSGFGDGWIDWNAQPVRPANATWLVVDANGARKFFVAFAAFENPTPSAPGTVVMRIKPVGG